MEIETERNGSLFCSYWLLSDLSATWTTVSTGVGNWKWEISVKSLLWQNFWIVSCYCVFSFPKRFVVKICVASWKAERETEFRKSHRSSLHKKQVTDRCLSFVQQDGSAATRMVLLSIQLTAVLQLLYLPHNPGAALYTTLCSTTATVPAPPHW